MYNINVNNCGVNSNEVYKVMFIELGTHIGMGMMISSRWGQWYPEWG